MIALTFIDMLNDEPGAEVSTDDITVLLYTDDATMRLALAQFVDGTFCTLAYRIVEIAGQPAVGDLIFARPGRDIQSMREVLRSSDDPAARPLLMGLNEASAEGVFDSPEKKVLH